MLFLLYLCALAISCFTTPNPSALHVGVVQNETPPDVYTKPVPPYAKWGRIAVAETAQKYPKYKVVDYLYMGHRNMGNSAQDVFRLWLRGADREFGVIVTVTFERQSQQLQSVSINPV